MLLRPLLVEFDANRCQKADGSLLELVILHLLSSDQQNEHVVTVIYIPP